MKADGDGEADDHEEEDDCAEDAPGGPAEGAHELVEGAAGGGVVLGVAADDYHGIVDEGGRGLVVALPLRGLEK